MRTLTFSLPFALPNSVPPTSPPPPPPILPPAVASPRGLSTHFWWMLTSSQSLRLRSAASFSASRRAAGRERGVSSTYLLSQTLCEGDGFSVGVYGGGCGCRDGSGGGCFHVMLFTTRMSEFVVQDSCSLRFGRGKEHRLVHGSGVKSTEGLRWRATQPAQGTLKMSRVKADGSTRFSPTLVDIWNDFVLDRAFVSRKGTLSTRNMSGKNRRRATD